MPQAQTYEDPVAKRKGEDPPRPVERVEYRVTVDRRTSIPGYPRRFDPGVHTVTVYKDQEQKLLDKVEDRPELVQTARERHESELAAHLVQYKKCKTEDEAKELIRTDPDRARELELETKFPGNKSTEALFYQMTRSLGIFGIRPISKAEKIRDLEPPEVNEQKMVRRTVEGLAEAMHAGGNGASGDVTELRKLVQEQAKRIDELENQLTSPATSKRSKS